MFIACLIFGGKSANFKPITMTPNSEKFLPMISVCHVSGRSIRIPCIVGKKKETARCISCPNMHLFRPTCIPIFKAWSIAALAAFIPSFSNISLAVLQVLASSVPFSA